MGGRPFPEASVELNGQRTASSELPFKTWSGHHARASESTLRLTRELTGSETEAISIHIYLDDFLEGGRRQAHV